LKKKPDLTHDFICGKCRHYKLIYLDELHFQWSGPFVCKSEQKNPGKKDPKTGKLKYYQKPCKYWEF